ncbi:MAG TPA: hypothetical protein VF653_13260 [Methylomirabilota bacterium]
MTVPRRQMTLVKELAAGTPVKEAARLSGFSKRTVERRLDDPEFRDRVAQAREHMLAKATDGLAKAADKAVETLRALLDAESDTVKLGASRAILDGLLRFQESEVLAERVRKLEGRQDAVRTYLANLTGEEVESFFFELKASVEGTRKP